MRLVGLAVALLGAIALVAAACGGTSSSDKTSTAAAGGVGGAQVTPVTTSAAAGTSTSGSPTAKASGSPTAKASAAATGTASGGATKLALSTASGNTIAFDKTTLNAPAGAQVSVTYTNNSDITHNVHFFKGSDASAPSLGMTQIAQGPSTQTVSFTAPTTPGSYYYQCDVHPTQMHGELVVQ